MTSCSSEERTFEKLQDARQERRVLLDKLYTDYGGSTYVGTAKSAVDDVAAGALADFVKSAVEEFDRGGFEEAVSAVGQGERPGPLPNEANGFFSREDVRDRCRQVSKLSLEVEKLTRELDQLRGTSSASEMP